MSTHSYANSTRRVDGDLLRLALTADGAATGAMGLGFVAASPLLDSWLGLPAAVLVVSGALLAVYAGLVLRLATRPAMLRAAVAGVIAANALWAVDTLLLVAFDGFSPTTAGEIVIAVQAIGSAAFAALQYAGLRCAR
jgi:hypothetical protein